MAVRLHFLPFLQKGFFEKNKERKKGRKTDRKHIFSQMLFSPPFMCQSFKAKRSKALEMRIYLKTSTLHAAPAQITPRWPVRFDLHGSSMEGMIGDLVTMLASKLRLAMW